MYEKRLIVRDDLYHSETRGPSLRYSRNNPVMFHNIIKQTDCRVLK